MTTSISGTSGITFPNASTSTVGGLGDGQTYQDVSASRSSGTTYTNSTGKPIFVFIYVTNNVTTTVVVGGTTIRNASATSTNQFSFIVPNGQTYTVTFSAGAGTILWTELR